MTDYNRDQWGGDGKWDEKYIFRGHALVFSSGSSPVPMTSQQLIQSLIQSQVEMERAAARSIPEILS